MSIFFSSIDTIISHIMFGWYNIFGLVSMYQTTAVDMCSFFCSQYHTSFLKFLIASSSGALFTVQVAYPNFATLIFCLVVLWVYVPLDFLILSRISSKNKTFLQNNPEKSAKNPHFIIFFIFWRIFLPDIFVASSLSARYFRMSLSKIQIFLISF